MMNNEIKMPANFAAIDENEMVYLQGGATTEATAWDVFLNVGKLFNYIARVFSAGSSIVNNINVIVTTFQTLSTFSLTAKTKVWAKIESAFTGHPLRQARVLFFAAQGGKHSPPNAGKQPFFCKAGGLSIDKAQEGVVY